LSFTEALADELKGTGITVQALCPGLTESEFHEVAGTDRVAFTRTARMDADDVAAYSLRALQKKRLRVIPGWHNRLVIGLQGFIPRRAVPRLEGAVLPPR